MGNDIFARNFTNKQIAWPTLEMAQWITVGKIHFLIGGKCACKTEFKKCLLTFAATGYKFDNLVL